MLDDSSSEVSKLQGFYFHETILSPRPSHFGAPGAAGATVTSRAAQEPGSERENATWKKVKSSATELERRETKTGTARPRREPITG